MSDTQSDSGGKPRKKQPAESPSIHTVYYDEEVPARISDEIWHIDEPPPLLIDVEHANRYLDMHIGLAHYIGTVAREDGQSRVHRFFRPDTGEIVGVDERLFRPTFAPRIYRKFGQGRPWWRRLLSGIVDRWRKVRI